MTNARNQGALPPGGPPTVYLVGAGPGAPDLLTLRAARLLQRADIVFHDALVPQEILSLSSGAIRIEVGKRSGRHSTAQAFINKRLVDAARTHRVVVRLKGGDPMLFGRAHEELSYLRRNRIRCEIIPGVTAALAATAEMGVSLTARGLSRSVAFLTTRAAAGERPNNWLHAALAADTVAIYMGSGQAGEISRALIAAGKPPATPVAIVEHASLPGERIALAFLELMQPSLADCASALYADGVRSLRVVPVFLGAGGHMKDDLPKLVAEIRGRFADLAIALEPPIGERPEVIAAIARAIAQ